jgi:hypothetical protein
MCRGPLLRKFLVGSLEVAGRLTEGSIDLQYNSFLKDESDLSVR